MEDPQTLRLDVYLTREGPWNPECGELDIPAGWEFLPAGDVFLTRHVEAGGVFWLAWRPRTRSQPHRRRLGLWAPSESIADARAAAVRTSASRERQREQGARQRNRSEPRYRDELAAAILDFLCFDPAYRKLAEGIARGAAQQAAEVGSGRVGRTQKLSLPERATLASRAWIRHRFTEYEDQLLQVLYGEAVQGEELIFGEPDLRDVRRAANLAVDEFLAEHRRPPGEAR
ncbi:MAG: DUF2293 domain-containing protein [Actinomycetota bacterium]|nr:DUF2293 domain-containing protein [Actinomycetota bacterium]